MASPWLIKRPIDRPYTQLGILRLKCIRCGRPKPIHQWQICADGNHWRPLCLPCDIELNRMVLKWAGDPDWEAKAWAYAVSEWRKWYGCEPMKEVEINGESINS